MRRLMLLKAGCRHRQYLEIVSSLLAVCKRPAIEARDMRAGALTLPEIFSDLILLCFFTADLVGSILSLLVHLFVVLANLRRLATGRRLRVGDLRLGLVGFLRTFRLLRRLAGVGRLLTALGGTRTAALALLGWWWAGVLQVGGRVGALVLGVLTLRVTLARAVVSGCLCAREDGERGALGTQSWGANGLELAETGCAEERHVCLCWIEWCVWAI
jgi:hypothetical protein